MVDYNKKQLDGTVKEVLDMGDIEAKLRAFGLDAMTIDGNNIEELYNSLKENREKGHPHRHRARHGKGQGYPRGREHIRKPQHDSH
jgi:transketolase